MEHIKVILSLIKKKYLSLRNPNFSFVQQAVRQKPYKELVESIANLFSITEDTDENNDVSFGFILRTTTAILILRISMVGPYYLLLKTTSDGCCFLIKPTTYLSLAEQQVIDLLSAKGLQMLDEGLLLQPINLTLSNAQANNTYIFQALFTDTDTIPWNSYNEETKSDKGILGR